MPGVRRVCEEPEERAGHKLYDRPRASASRASGTKIPTFLWRTTTAWPCRRPSECRVLCGVRQRIARVTWHVGRTLPSCHAFLRS